MESAIPQKSIFKCCLPENVPILQSRSGSGCERCTTSSGSRIILCTTGPVVASACCRHPAVMEDLSCFLTHVGTSAKVHVFGVDHRSAHPRVGGWSPSALATEYMFRASCHSIARPGEFILSARPQAVVVETSVTPEHGSLPGNSIGLTDEIVQGPPGFFFRMFCQVEERHASSWPPFHIGNV